MISILLATFAIMLASLAGVFFAWKGFAKFFERNATILTNFAIGVFIAVVYTLFREAHHEGLAYTELFLWGLSGAVFLEMISRIIPGAHHHHETSHNAHIHSRLDAKRLLLGDAIHNIGDGIILVPAFFVDIRFGIATAIGIFIHEVLQEIAQFFILKTAGYSTRRALLYNFLSSSTIFIGVVISLNVAFSDENLAILLAISGGGFLYVIFRDLLPDTFHVVHCTKRYFFYSTIIALGVLTMLAVSLIVPH